MLSLLVPVLARESTVVCSTDIYRSIGSIAKYSSTGSRKLSTSPTGMISPRHRACITYDIVLIAQNVAFYVTSESI